MYILPELKKPYTAYEPYIDAETMQIHHLKHHVGYVTKLNQALADSEHITERIEDLFEKTEELPTILRNNAGAHYNHTVFWTILNDTMSTPSTDLMNLINKQYGFLEDFKAEFTKAALSVFGSGWVWLTITRDGSLSIMTTPNQDNPLMSHIDGGYPLIGLDVWEHAYYLKHHNKRIDYINSFWSILDWEEVSFRLLERPEMNDIR
jgi:Fe-Mn family superoxide dismutase